MSAETDEYISIPVREVGPIRIRGVLEEDIKVPLATLESPLWPSVGRGAVVSRLCGGIHTVWLDDRMTRSVVVRAPDAEYARRVLRDVRSDYKSQHRELAAVVARGSRYARLLEVHGEVIGRLLFLRIEVATGDAAGHNMTTAAAERVLDWLLGEYPELEYISISGNYCTDKKPSAVNAILGRGRRMVAEAVVSRELCQRRLRTTPEKMVEINTVKNLVGSVAAGCIRAANAHYANMLLALYLATGQDAANIVEGSQGITYAELNGEDLYFSVTVPHIIVGTVGAGKQHPFARRNLEKLGCRGSAVAGENATRLAAIAAAVVWCGELSLLAAQTNRGELMRAHAALERRGRE